MRRELPSASIIEGVRFTAQVAVPHLIQGIFRRRRKAVALATKANVDGHAVGLVAGLRRAHGPGPVWIRVARERVLLVLSGADAGRALEAAPEPLAADPESKRKGMSHFQPDALTISRGDLWRNRRRFNEAVLDTGEPLHRQADRFAAVAREEGSALIDRVAAGSAGRLEWNAFNAALRRAARRVILGDGAAEDEEVSELLGKLMDEANQMPSERSERFQPFMERIEGYVRAAERGSLVALFTEAPADEDTRPAGQVPHWLFALGDTLATNAFRALALLAAHPDQRARAEGEIAAAAIDSGAAVAGLGYLDACLHEAMRLWVTTPLLAREAVEDTDWDGEPVPQGTQVMIFNTFLHRDPETHDFADRFAPEAWTEGEAADDPAFNHFSRGPQGCPGTGIAMLVGKALLAQVLTSREPVLLSPALDRSRPLPRMLDPFGIRVELRARA
jgi:cytochrome P450